MLKWLYLKLIGGCDHKWENIKEEIIAKKYSDVSGNYRAVTFFRYHQRCKDCGKMKIFDAR